jgi:hypothetical protein
MWTPLATALATGAALARSVLPHTPNDDRDRLELVTGLEPGRLACRVRQSPVDDGNVREVVAASPGGGWSEVVRWSRDGR